MASQTVDALPPNSGEMDPFDAVLNVEDDLYAQAYAAGTADGAKAGRIEGRVFGLEKGFEKFTSMGRLHGRSVVWAARIKLSKSTPRPPSSSQSAPVSNSGNLLNSKIRIEQEKTTTPEPEAANLPPLPSNSRLPKHVSTLHALTEAGTFSTLNTEEAVADFDDRFKRAGAKFKVIERLIGESGYEQETERVEKSQSRDASQNETEIKLRQSTPKPRGDNMEDFQGIGLRT